MSVESYTFKGKVVYVVSESNLAHYKKVGRNIRATCPVHNSRDLDASIAPYFPGMSDDDAWLAGWGHCHGASCNADFLVKEWNPRKARYITQSPIETSEPKIQLTARDLEKVEEWQRLELASLNKIHDAMCARLQHPRAQAYLTQRGIAHMTDLLTRLEVGYIPPENEWNPPPRLRKWCDRLVFPYTTGEGERGYAGRTLRLWTPGMDENEHKRVLDEHNKQLEEQHAGETFKYQVRRWEKTYRSGFFNMQAAREHRHVYLMEGSFDTFPALYEGLPNVIAVAGTHFDAAALPKTVLEITMAFDADSQGQDAAQQTKNIFEKLGRAGIRYNFLCAPADDRGKDWSERYRLHGREGIAPLFSQESQAQEEAEPTVEGCPVCGILPELNTDVEFYPDEQGRLYCQTHWTGSLPETQVRLLDGRIAPAMVSEKPTQERFVEIAQRLARALPEGCAVHLDPPEYTIEDRAREVAQEIRERQLEREALVSTTQEEYWAKVRARLGNFVAEVPAEMLAHAQRPRIYPAPFPKFELQLGDDGRYHLATVGMWESEVA